MKKFLTLLCLIISGFVSTSCYDDSALWESVNDLDQRMKTLEALCNEMNTNLTSLQSLVNAMKQGEYILDVSPLKEDGVEVGYQITFSEHGVVNIYHGKNGEGSGDVPQFGAKQDTDGAYYWTVNGEWVLDDNGHKLPVSSSDTAPVIPELRVENDKWYVSYDEGKTWKEIGDAVSGGNGECLFKDVKLTADSVTLILSDGTVFEFPIGERFRIVLGDFDVESIQYGVDIVIPYKVEGAKGAISMFAVSDGQMFDIELVKETGYSGKLTVRQNDYYDEEKNGTVALFAVSEDGTTISKVIGFMSGVLHPVSGNNSGRYLVDAVAGKMNFTVATNRLLEVNTNADWITYAETKAVEEKTLVFDIKDNEGGRRKTVVEIASGDVCFEFEVVQKGFSDQFSVNVSCDEVRGGTWKVCIDTLLNRAGKHVYEALGYSSWDEVAAAAGNWDSVYGRKGEVLLLAYDLYSGEALPYDECRNGTGFYHDKDGGLVSVYDVTTTSWTWLMDSLLINEFEFNASHVENIHAGESYSFGILLTSPEGEARIEVTINVTEYIDPEKGLYDNPAAPGRYEFTVRDSVYVDSKNNNIDQVIRYNRDIAESIKSTIGLTTYEISGLVNDGEIDLEYRLVDGEILNGRESLSLDVKGYHTEWNVNSLVAELIWNFGLVPENLNVFMFIPYEGWNKESGYIYYPAVYRAVGKTVKYEYCIRYNGYELVFTHEISFVGENPSARATRLLTGNGGSKVWMYDFEYPYGNGGHTGNGAGFDSDSYYPFDGFWWGVNNADELVDQIDYLTGGIAYGDESDQAYMVFSDNSTVSTYTPAGTIIRSGNFEVLDYDPDRSSGWELGKLVTSEPATLFPWQVNGSGNSVTEFDIMYLTDEEMALVYTGGAESGSWNEITYWRFISEESVKEKEWFLTGDFNGWISDNQSYMMTYEDGWYVYYGFTTDDTQMKVTQAGWEDCRGGAYAGANKKTSLNTDSDNLIVPSGKYDVYLNLAATEIYFMTPGFKPGEAVYDRSQDGNCIVVASQDMVDAAWDSQFWITFDQELKEGDAWEISMDIKADMAAQISTFTESEPGCYLYWDAIGVLSFTEEWINYTSSGTAHTEMTGGKSIDFLLNSFEERANRYYFDNISFKINGVEQIDNGSCEDPAVRHNFLSKEYPSSQPTEAKFIDIYGNIL